MGLRRVATGARRPPAKGFVVSDLHVFARRSDASGRLDAIRAAARAADFFVFNGDTFDFQWTELRSIEASVAAARDWIEDLACHAPACRFWFLLGNHDCIPAYREALADLERRLPNLSWHEHQIRLGCCVFLHGDMAHRRMDRGRLVHYRRNWERKRRRGRVLNRCYDLVGRARLDRAFARVWLRKHRVARRILFYLESLDRDLLDGVEDVYFGHTHVAFSGFAYRGLRFHNTGSAVRGSRFDLRPIDLVTATSEHD